MKPRTVQKIFKGRLFSIERAGFQLPHQKKGHLKKYDIVRHGGSSVILPILNKNRLVLIRQMRPAVGKQIWELPAGTLDAGEKPLTCARRELIEETGYRPGRLKRLTTLWPSPGFCDEVMHIYLATQLRFVGQNLEADESLRVRIVPVKRVLRMIQRGTIQDAKTISAVCVWKLGK